MHQIIAQIIAQITECKKHIYMDIKQLQDDIRATIYSNGRGEVTAEKEQRVLIAITDAIIPLEREFSDEFNDDFAR